LSEPAVIGWGIGLESPQFFLLQARERFCEFTIPDVQ